MRRLRIPLFGPAKRPGRSRAPDEPAKHRSKGRAKSGGHIPQHSQGTIPPWSQQGDYSGRHRKSDPPPPGRRAKVGQHKTLKQGKRQTPADDRPNRR